MHWFTLHRVGVMCAMALFCAGVVRADMVPSLTWTGDVIVVSQLGPGGASGGNSFNATDTGIASGASCFEYGGNCPDYSTVDRSFTVTSPGDFVVSTSLDFSGNAVSCNPGTCFDTASFSGSLNGSTSILGVDSQPFSDSGTQVATDCFDPSVNCFLTVDFSDERSDVTYLGLGDYTMEQNYSINGHGMGDLVWDAGVGSSLVPTPEPRGEIAILAAGLLMALVLRRRKTLTV